MATKKETEKEVHVPQRLYRSETDKVIGGVCGGLGDYLGIDTTIIRIIFVLLTVFGGSGLLLYVILWVVVPSQKSVTHAHEYMKANVDEIKEKAKGVADSIRSPKPSNNRMLFAGAIILIGLVILLNNFGFYQIDFGKLWPIWLIVAGLLLLRRR